MAELIANKTCKIKVLAVDIIEQSDKLKAVIEYIKINEIDIAILQRPIVNDGTGISTIKVVKEVPNYLPIYNTNTTDKTNSNFLYLVKLRSEYGGKLSTMFEPEKARKSLLFTSNRISIITVKLPTLQVMFASGLLDPSLEQIIKLEVNTLNRYYGHAPVLFVVNDDVGDGKTELPHSSDFKHFFDEIHPINSPMRIFVSKELQRLCPNMGSQTVNIGNTLSYLCTLNIHTGQEQSVENIDGKRY